MDCIIPLENQAIVSGLPVRQFPDDLFIPPDALEVLLDSFSGPLDLLLYLIRKQSIDILDIPIALITEQYMQYITLLESHRLELAADYLVMAAVLAEIKSRLLLPPTSSQELVEESDPRLELVRKLQLYEQFKQAAYELDKIPRHEREHHLLTILPPEDTQIINQPEVDLVSLVAAMQAILLQTKQNEDYQVVPELYSVKARMVIVLQRIQQKKVMSFTQLLVANEGRAGLVVTFLAVLELIRQYEISVNQSDKSSAIYLKVNE